MDPHRNQASRRPLCVVSSRLTVQCVIAAISTCWILSWADRCEAGQDSRDYQGWAGVSLVTPLAEGTELKLDGLLLADDGGPHAARELVRGVVRTKVSKRIMLGGGYVWTRVDTGAAAAVEHRAVQQIDAGLPLAWRGASLSVRTQLEERFRNGGRGMSLRVRHLTRLDAPVSGSDLSVVAWGEYFHELRDTSWAGAAGPGLLLSFLGVRVPVSPRVSVEPGYLNQTVFNSGRNPVTHVAAIFVTIRR